MRAIENLGCRSDHALRTWQCGGGVLGHPSDDRSIRTDGISRQRQPFEGRHHVNAIPELRAGNVKGRSRAYARAARSAAALTFAEHSSTLNTVRAGGPVYVHTRTVTLTLLRERDQTRVLITSRSRDTAVYIREQFWRCTLA